MRRFANVEAAGFTWSAPQRSEAAVSEREVRVQERNKEETYGDKYGQGGTTAMGDEGQRKTSEEAQGEGFRNSGSGEGALPLPQGSKEKGASLVRVQEPAHEKVARLAYRIQCRDLAQEFVRESLGRNKFFVEE